MRDKARPLRCSVGKAKRAHQSAERWHNRWAWRYATLPTLQHRVCRLSDPQRLELAVQRGALHADKLRGARNIAAEAVDLRAEIFALEHLARIAQRQAHQVLAAIAVRQARHHRA